MHVSELWVYPIKSCRGIAVDALELDDRGARGDRRWMLVDAESKFISQRTAPRLALVDVARGDSSVVVSAPGMPPLAIGTGEAAVASECVIWKDTVTLEPAARAAHEWFSELLDEECRLMYMPDRSERLVNPKYSPEPRLVSLADGYPLMLIGQGSLDLLNEKLTAQGEQPVPMKRFRPNIVVTSSEPHAEDTWRQIRLGEINCSVVKPCERCAIPTIDIETGIAGKEPSRTLARYRKFGSNIWFGQNLIHEQPGTLHVGDAASVY